MGTKIYHPITPEVRDQTGLKLCGRHKDGGYQYRSYSVFHANNVVTLTHTERVGLAICAKLAPHADVYPMTRSRRYQGFGTKGMSIYGGCNIWLARPQLAALGQSFLDGETPKLGPNTRYYSTVPAADTCLAILAHETGHNFQDGGRPHGSEFQRAELDARIKVEKAIRRGWPKLDMRRLRDSVAPHLVKKAAKKMRREVAASETRTSKWTKKVNAAERNLDKWRKALVKAERMIVKWEKALRHARVFLAKAQADEEVQG